MKSRNRPVWIVLALLVVAFVALQLTGKRVLVWQARDSDGFACRYFTGRTVIIRTYYDSGSSVNGVDECPLLISRGID